MILPPVLGTPFKALHAKYGEFVPWTRTIDDMAGTSRSFSAAYNLSRTMAALKWRICPHPKTVNFVRDMNFRGSQRRACGLSLLKKK